MRILGIYSIRRENNIAQNSNRGTPHVEEMQKEIALSWLFTPIHCTFWMESLHLHSQGNWQTLSRMTINRLRVLTHSRVGTHFISEKVAYLKWNAYLCMVAIQDRLFKRKWGVGVLTHSRVGTPFFRQMLVRSLGNDYLCIDPLKQLNSEGNRIRKDKVPFFIDGH